MARNYGMFTYCSNCGKSSEACSCTKALESPQFDKMVNTSLVGAILEPEPGAAKDLLNNDEKVPNSVTEELTATGKEQGNTVVDEAEVEEEELEEEVEKVEEEVEKVEEPKLVVKPPTSGKSNNRAKYRK